MFKKSKYFIAGFLLTSAVLAGCSTGHKVTKDDVLINGKYLSQSNIENLYNYNSYGDYTVSEQLFEEIIDTYDAGDYDLKTEFESYLKDTMNITEITSETSETYNEEYREFKNNFLAMKMYEEILGITEDEIKKAHKTKSKTTSILIFNIPANYENGEQEAKKFKKQIDATKDTKKLSKIVNDLNTKITNNFKADNFNAESDEDIEQNYYTVNTVTDFDKDNYNTQGKILMNSLKDGAVITKEDNGSHSIYVKTGEYNSTLNEFRLNYVSVKAEKEGLTGDLVKIMEGLNALKEPDTNFPKEIVNKIKAEQDVQVEHSEKEEKENDVSEEDVKAYTESAENLEESLNDKGGVESTTSMEDEINNYSK